MAFFFWAFTGITLGLVKVLRPQDQYAQPKILVPTGAAAKRELGKLIRRIIFSHKTHLLLILILALGLRYYNINVPLADWHSWRQADTSAVTRNYVRYGVNLLYPRYDDLSSVPSGRPNPEGYRFVEFPLYNGLAVIVDRLFPGYNVEYSGRLTSIFASLGSLIFIYLISKKYFSHRVGLIAAGLFAVLPYNLYWSRVILPEPFQVFLTTGLVYFFDKWVESSKKRFWLTALVFAISALLVKFSVIFFAVPLAYLVWHKWGWKSLANPWVYLFAIFTIVPFLAWRWHISRYPEGIPAYMWLFNGNGIRFKGSWFWWLFAERLAKLILGGWGVVLLSFGLVRKELQGAKPKFLFHFWLLGLLIYLAVFATGNVQHDYYQTILTPILCIFMALGIDYLWDKTAPNQYRWLARGMMFISLFFMLMFGWYQIKDLYNINHPEIVEAGKEFERLVPNNQVKVIAPYGGDTAFLYQTGKRGWPIVEGTIEEMIGRGAQFYISTNFDELTQELIKTARKSEKGLDILHNYKIIKYTDMYVIIQLVPNKLLPSS